MSFQGHLESTYQELLCTLGKLSGCVYDNSDSVCNLDISETCDLDTVKNLIEHNRNTERKLSGIQQQLEEVGFDVQYFISEHAQFLNPAQSRHILKTLSATQRALREQQREMANQTRTLGQLLGTREEESLQKV